LPHGQVFGLGSQDQAAKAGMPQDGLPDLPAAGAGLAGPSPASDADAAVKQVADREQVPLAPRHQRRVQRFRHRAHSPPVPAFQPLGQGQPHHEDRYQ